MQSEIWPELGCRVELVRSGRKTLALQIQEPGVLLVRAPARMSAADIRRFVLEKRNWITKHLAMAEARETEKQTEPRLTWPQLNALADQALEVLPPRVRFWADRLGVRYGRITVRNQRTRWGSCSSRGNLNFNCLLMLCPQEVADYVIVHELCHRKEMNHSPRFWALVESQLPDWRERRAWLKQNGPALMARMPE